MAYKVKKTFSQKAEAAEGRLSPAKRVYVKNRLAGETIAASSAAAGVSSVMGGRYDKDPDVRIVYAAAIRETFPVLELVDLVKGGAHATSPVFNNKGKIIDERPDWKTRRPYIEMAAEHGGYVDKKDDKSNVPSITVVVQHIGSVNAQENQSRPEATAETESTT